MSDVEERYQMPSGSLKERIIIRTFGRIPEPTMATMAEQTVFTDRESGTSCSSFPTRNS